MSYEAPQEAAIEDAYADFFSAISQGNMQEAQAVINGMEALEYHIVAADMTKILAGKRLSYA